MSSTPTEHVPLARRKSGCSSHGSGLGALLVLALIPIGIVGIIHAVDYKKEKERNETIRDLAAQNFTAEEIREIMQMRHPSHPPRPVTHYDVEHAKIMAAVVTELVEREVPAEHIAAILHEARFNGAPMPRHVKTGAERKSRPERVSKDKLDQAIEKALQNNNKPATAPDNVAPNEKLGK